MMACENKTDLCDPTEAGTSEIAFQSLLQINGPVHQPGLIGMAPYSDPTKLPDGSPPSQLISLQPNPSPLFPHQIFQQPAEQRSPTNTKEMGKSSYIALACSTSEIPAPQSKAISQPLIHNDQEPSQHLPHKGGPGLDPSPHGSGQRQYQLLVNMNQVKVKKQSKYVCNHCGRDCLKPSVLEKHIRSHTGERPFPCTTCGISFKTQSNLYKHKRTQTHVNNCRLLTGSESGPSSALICVAARYSDINIQQEDGQKGSTSYQRELLVPKSNNMDLLGNQGFPNMPWDMFWSRNSTTEKGENEVIDGEKQGAQQQEAPTGNKQISLQRQQATYFAKQWINKSSSSSVQTNESTDSGYFSHSDSSDQQSCSLGSVWGFQGQSTDTEPGRASQSSQSLVSAEQSAGGLSTGENAVQGMDRNQLGKLELGERISKLISDNKAVVDDKQLENVRPRKMAISKQGSIDLPMPYTFKDSFHFDMKSSHVNKRSNLSSSLPKAIPSSSGKLQQTFLSLPSHLAPTVDCLPVIRSNSLPPGEYNVLSNKMAKVLSYGPEKHCTQRTSSAAFRTENSLSRSLDFHPSHHRTLVRQTALEDSQTSVPIVDGSSTAGERISNVTEFRPVSRSKHKCLEKRNSQKKLTKFSHEKWSMYGEETFRKKYQAVKRTSSAMPMLQCGNQVTQISTINCANHTVAQDRVITVLSENQHTSSMATSSIHKTPVRKHLSDPLIFGPVKVTTFNNQMFQAQFLPRNFDNSSFKQTNPDPCRSADKTTTPLIQELPVITTSSSDEPPNTDERSGNTNSAGAVQETTDCTTKGLPLLQPSSVPSLQKEKDHKRSIQRHFSHPKLVRQLSVQVPENKAVQESIKVKSQQENQPEEYIDTNNGVSKLSPAKPPKKKQRLKLVNIENPTEDLQFDSNLPGVIVLSQSFPFVGTLTSNGGHGHLQSTNSPKQPSPTVSISFIDFEQALSNQSKSCPESVATSSTFLPQFLPSDSEAKAEIMEDSGGVVQPNGFPLISDTVGSQANHPNKVFRMESHMIQCVTPVPLQVKDPYLQKHHFLPKYQLKWPKMELIRLPSALATQTIVHEETSEGDSQTSQWNRPKPSHHDQQTPHPTLQPSFNEVQKTEGCELVQHTHTVSEGSQLPSAIHTTAVVTNLIHLMNKRFQWSICSQPGGKLHDVHWPAANSLHRGRWAPVSNLAHSLLGQCQQGASNVKLNGELDWSNVTGSGCQQIKCTSGGERYQNWVQCRSRREPNIPLTEVNSDNSSFQKMTTQPELTWCYLRKTVPLHTQQKDRSTSVYATWGTCENASDRPSLALKDTVIVDRLQQKGRDTSAQSLKKLHSHSRQRLAPKSLVTTKGRRRRVAKHRRSSSSDAGRQVDDSHKRGRGHERHKCKECGVCFQKPSNLKIHLQTHISEQAYHCKLCDRSFKTKGNLTKHVESKIHRKTQAKPQTHTNPEGQELAEEGERKCLNGKQHLLKWTQVCSLASSTPKSVDLHSQFLIKKSSPFSNGRLVLYQPGEAVVCPADCRGPMISPRLVLSPNPSLSESSKVAWTLTDSENSTVSLCSQIPVWSLSKITAISEPQKLSIVKGGVNELTNSNSTSVCVLPVAAVPEQANSDALSDDQNSSATHVANSKTAQLLHLGTETILVSQSSGSSMCPTAVSGLPLQMEIQQRSTESIKDHVLKETEALQTHQAESVLLCSGDIQPSVNIGMVQLLHLPAAHSQSSSAPYSCQLQIGGQNDVGMTGLESAQPNVLLLPSGLSSIILQWPFAGCTVPTFSSDHTILSAPQDPAIPTVHNNRAITSVSSHSSIPTISCEPVIPSISSDSSIPTISCEPVIPSISSDSSIPTICSEPAIPSVSSNPIASADSTGEMQELLVSVSGCGVVEGQACQFRETPAVQNVGCTNLTLAKLGNTAQDRTESPVSVLALDRKYSESMELNEQKLSQQKGLPTPSHRKSNALPSIISGSLNSESGPCLGQRKFQWIDGKQCEGIGRSQDLPTAALSHNQRRGKSLEMTNIQHQMENEESSSDEDRLIIETE